MAKSHKPVVSVAQLGLAEASNTDLLRHSHDLGRIFVTRDRDFGGLIFVEGLGAGVIYLRVLPSTQVTALTLLKGKSLSI